MKESSIIKKLPVNKADMVLLKIPYEGTVSGGAGASKGPEAICDMLKYQVEEWDYILKKRVCDKVNVVEREVNVGGFKPERMVEAVEKETLKLLDNNKFVAALGGEHTVSVGVVAAMKRKFSDLTVVQIDAHSDMRDSNGDYEDDPKKITRYAHSCAMRRVYDLGCQVVQVGIRSMSPLEYEFISEKRLERNIFYDPVKASCKKIIDRCETDKVYFTIDVDGFEPSVMPATGTPEPGGLSWGWVLEFSQELFKRKKVVGMDINEVAPRESDERTEFAAAKLLYHLIGLKFL